MSSDEIVDSGTDSPLRLKAYCGDRSVLLAFDLDRELAPYLAGFSIQCTPPGHHPYYLLNRLGFQSGITSETSPEQRKWTPSNRAPFQKFRWMHFPPQILPGLYGFKVSAMYIQPDGSLRAGPSAEVSADLLCMRSSCPRFELGFTRGYIFSQGYATKFNNAPVSPKPKSMDYDTGPYKKQYQWLGGHGRELLFGFLDEALSDPAATIDVFAFDLDEPDVIRKLAMFGNRLRILLDDSHEHTGPNDMEPKARAVLEESAGKDQVRTGHFHRFAHNKVLIQKRDGHATRVLTGSANFSVRGLYVQANNILVYDDPTAAGLYEQAFEQAFGNIRQFRQAPISQKWFDLTGDGIPRSAVCFSPHQTAQVSLDALLQAIQGAKSSVLFAVMEMDGKGEVLKTLRELPGKEGIFSYGITQQEKGDIDVFTATDTNGVRVPFAFLRDKVPPSFRPEYRAGIGQVIHHKFVVVDFNKEDAVLFTGSSNLSEGGERENGDNLLAIHDPAIITAYAVEAIRLVDHYRFRAVWQKATEEQPLVLTYDPAKPWWAPYYDPKDIRHSEREVLVSST